MRPRTWRDDMRDMAASRAAPTKTRSLRWRAVALAGGAMLFCIFMHTRQPTRCRSLLFAAHDPGAQNDIRPLYEAALHEGMTATWLDLRANGTLLKGDHNINRSLRSAVRARKLALGTCLCVTGLSTNWAELAVADECRQGEKAPTVSVMLFLAGDRLHGAPHTIRRIHWLLGSTAAADELGQRHGIASSKLHVTGSAYLEWFRRHAKAPTAHERTDVLAGLQRQMGQQVTHLVLLCISAADGYVDGLEGAMRAVPMLVHDACAAASTASRGGARAVAVVVRPHPRSPAKLLHIIDEAASACGKLGLVARDGELAAYLRASSLVAAHASTTLVEATLLGVPALFYKRGYEASDAFGEGILGSVSHGMLPRVHSAAELGERMEAALAHNGGGDSALIDAVEGHVGATARQWTVLQTFL